MCPLTLDYIADWLPLFREFHRVLKPGGQLIYSHGHPMSDFNVVRKECDPDSVYFDVEEHELDWGGFGEPRPTIRFYRRPLGAMLNPLIEAGFALDRTLEPLPTEDFRRAAPEEHARLLREPLFLCVRAVKRG